MTFDADQSIGAGQDNYVLTYDNSSGKISLEAAAGGGLANVVDDPTPQLGGSLDVNGQKIVSVSNGNIDIEPNGTGNVLLGNFTFDADQTVGAGQDNYVLTYDNATGLISLEASAGGGGGGDVVDDTTPQLGGDLDVNSNSIISAAGSNGAITIAPDGTGKIHLNSGNIQTNLTDTVAIGDKTIIGSPTFSNYLYSTLGFVTGDIKYVNARNMDVTAGGTNGGRLYNPSNIVDVALTSGTNVTGSNARMRLNLNFTAVDMNGSTYEGTSMGRGIIAHMFNSIVMNDSTSNATVGRYINMENVMFPSVNRDFDTGSAIASGGDLNIANLYCMNAGIDRADQSGAGTTYVTSDSAVYRTDPNHRNQNDGITWNSGALAYNIKNDKTDLAEKFGSVKNYSELAYEATHSASGTFTVDYDNGNSQIITLSDNITSFTMSNFPGDNQWSGTPMIGAVTLYLKQDGTGSRTVSFTAGASETFKIANGITTVDSGANNYTVVHVQNVDGVYLWTISGNYQ
jgi:hypothetical protein